MRELGRSLGGYLAMLRFPDNGSVDYEKTLGRGHYTLRGEPGAMLECVVSVQKI